jgi:hypothetical protein
MEYPKVSRLYKYYAYNEHSRSVLINKMVWFSKPATLNDPFDIDIDFDFCMSPSKFNCMINVDKNRPGISTEEMEKLKDLERDNPNALNEISEIANDQFREDRKNLGVFCMSESKRDILMWSHYGDHHKGFCIEFLRSPENDLGELEKTRPVTYNCVYPTPDPTEEKCYDELFFTKAKGWAYEKEWRMLNDEKGDVLLPLPGAITAIIFGLKMPSQHRATIKNILAKNPEIKYQRAEKVPKQFKLKIVDCESTHA